MYENSSEHKLSTKKEHLNEEFKGKHNPQKSTKRANEDSDGGNVLNKIFGAYGNKDDSSTFNSVTPTKDAIEAIKAYEAQLNADMAFQGPSPGGDMSNPFNTDPFGSGSDDK